MTTMNFQETFDELISCSMAALEPLQGYKPCSTLKSSHSIDDFLADYRHESSSIVSFLSCLEESDIATYHSGTISCAHSFWKNASASHAYHQRPEFSTLNIGSIGAKQCDESRKRGRDASHQQPLPALKAVRAETDDQKERRRRKNCEYQRRFREKKIRLEMQRRYTATCPSSVEFPYPRLA